MDIIDALSRSRCRERGLNEQKWFYCAAIDCGPLDGVQNAVLSSIESTTYNSSATFQCSPGYWFYRGVFALSTTCRDDGLWIALEFTACKRQYQCGVFYRATQDVCPPHTHPYCVKTAKRTVKLFSPSDNHAILILPYPTLWQYSDWDPLTRGRRMQLGGVWINRGCRPISHFISEMMQWR